MQLKPTIAACIYIGSYLPLSAILLAQDIDYSESTFVPCTSLAFKEKCVLPLDHPYIAIGLFVLCLICFFVCLISLLVVRPKNKIVIEESKHVPADLMNYILPYVVSFMSLDYATTNKFVGFLIFFAWIFLISYKSGQIILNPILTVFGWKLYEVKYRFEDSHNLLSGMTLSKVPLEPNGSYQHQSIQDVLIIKK
jgi:hypothetical protein